GVALASERDRPEHVKAAGLLLALTAAIAFALRDTLVRWLAVDTGGPPQPAISATLATGALTMLLALLVSRRRLPAPRAWAPFVPAGILFGLSYGPLYEHFTRA